MVSFSSLRAWCWRLFTRAPESKIIIGVLTSAQKFNIDGFLKMLESWAAEHTHKQVKFIQLPYNDLDSFRLDEEGLHGVILCHSIHNRRFAITDVLDALYDKFLPHAKKLYGQNNVFVVVHDFPWPLRSSQTTPNPHHVTPSDEEHANIKKAHEESFRIRQPTTFESCKVAIICGKLDEMVEIDDQDSNELKEFTRSISAHESLQRRVREFLHTLSTPGTPNNPHIYL